MVFTQRYNVAKLIPIFITALYQHDVQVGDKRIPFKMVKYITREF